jgi:outer membrane protein assembly factor BamD
MVIEYNPLVLSSRVRGGILMNRLHLRPWRAVIVSIVLGFTLAACSSTADKKPQRTAEELYDDAQQELANGAWDAAAKGFEAVQTRSPFGRLAQQAMMDQAYAQYRSFEPAQALTTIDQFIKQYPNHVAVDYMYYLRGLVNFNDGSSFLDSISGQDPSERDPKALHDSFDAFKDLVTRFPESPYAEDSRQRMHWLVNALAGHEVHVARYYFRRGAYVAAINRAQTAVRDFDGSPALDEALAIMAFSYDKLGMKKEGEDARRVLTANFPNSKFLTDGLRDPERKWWQFW